MGWHVEMHEVYSPVCSFRGTMRRDAGLNRAPLNTEFACDLANSPLWQRFASGGATCAVCFRSSVRPIRRAICSVRSRSVNSLRMRFPRSAKAQPRPRYRGRPRQGPLATPSPTAVQAAANITLTGVKATRDVRDASEIPGSRAAVLEVRIHLPPAASPCPMVGVMTDVLRPTLCALVSDSQQVRAL